MVLTEDAGIGNYHIRAYDAESVTINKTLYTSSLIVSPYKLIPDWEPKSLEDLKPEHFEALLSLNPEVVIFGTGKNLFFRLKKSSCRFSKNELGLNPWIQAALVEPMQR